MDKLGLLFTCGLQLMDSHLNLIVKAINDNAADIDNIKKNCCSGGDNNNHNNDNDNQDIGGGSVVTITPNSDFNESNGERIADYSIDGIPGKLYARKLKSLLLSLNDSNLPSSPSSGTGDKWAIGRNAGGNWDWIKITNSGGNSNPETPTVKEILFFLNWPKDDEGSVVAPLEGDYLNGTFKHRLSGGGIQEWKTINENPATNEDTWVIWVWFENDIPKLIQGPLNYTKGGSNGADSEETEYIYFLSSTKLSSDIIAPIREKLASYKGDVLARDGKTFRDPDAIPKIDSEINIEWFDTAQGIDENNKYEYEAYRKSSLNGEGKRIWGETGFSGPHLRSAYGELGVDGDGVEYIFYADINGNIDAGDDPSEWNEETPGKNGMLFQEDEFIALNSKWMDNPVDFYRDLVPGTDEKWPQGSVLYVSIRKKRDGLWQEYSKPKLWNIYSKDGVVDGYTVDIDNENMPVGVSSGTIESWEGFAEVQAYHNGSQLTCVTSSTLLSDQFSYTIRDAYRSDEATIDSLKVRITPDGAKIKVKITNLDNFEGVNIYIPVVVKLPNGSSKVATVTVYGVPGSTYVDLYLSQKVVHTTWDKSAAVPPTMNIGVTLDKVTYLSKTDSSSTDSAESKGYTFKYYYDTNVNYPTPHRGPISIEPNHNSITVIMYYNNKFVDSEELPYVADGKDAKGIVSLTPYYKAFSTTGLHLLTGLDKDSLGIDEHDAKTEWSAQKPYLYSGSWTVYDDGSSGWYTLYFLYEKEWSSSELGESIYLITSLNDNAGIDDNTVNNNVLKIATLNPVLAWKDNTNITSESGYTITVGQTKLPNGLLVDTDLSNSDYSGYKVFYIKNNGTVNSYDTGTYSYDLELRYNGNLIKTKKCLLVVENISESGELYKLEITHDTVSYDGTESNILSTDTIEIIAHKYSPEEEEVTITGIGSSNNGIYIEVPSGLNLSRNSNGKGYKVNHSDVPYNVNGYDITLRNLEGKFLDKEHIDCRKDGKDSTGDGESSVTYTLVPSPSSIKFSYNESGSEIYPSYVDLSCGWTKSVGTEVTKYTGLNDEDLHDIDGKYNIIYRTINNVGVPAAWNSNETRWVKDLDGRNNIPDFVIRTPNTTTYTGYEIVLTSATTLATINDSNIIARITVPIIFNGKPGGSGTGLVGRFYYYAGDWDEITANPGIYVTDRQYPYVKYGNNYYMYIGLVPEGGYISKNNTPEDGTGNWEMIVYNRYIMSDAIFSKYAHLGSIIINKDWLISQYGLEYSGVYTTSTNYSSFDPIAFMNYLHPSDDGTFIGINSNSNPLMSLMFLLNGHAAISMKWTGTTQLVKIITDYRPDNSEQLVENLHYKVIATFSGGGDRTGNSAINTAYWDENDHTLSEHSNDCKFNSSNPVQGYYYCFIGGNITYLRVKYTSNISRFFIPNYALDLRGGFVYLNNAYIKGKVEATSFKVINPEISNDLASIEFTTMNLSLRDTYRGLLNSGIDDGVPVGLVYGWNDDRTLYIPKYFFDFAPVNPGNLDLKDITLYKITAGAGSGEVYLLIAVDQELYYVTEGPETIKNKYISRPRYNGALANIESSDNLYVKGKTYTSLVQLSGNEFIPVSLTVYTKIIITDGNETSDSQKYGYLLDSFTTGTVFSYRWNGNSTLVSALNIKGSLSDVVWDLESYSGMHLVLALNSNSPITVSDKDFSEVTIVSLSPIQLEEHTLGYKATLKNELLIPKFV